MRSHRMLGSPGTRQGSAEGRICNVRKAPIILAQAAEGRRSVLLQASTILSPAKRVGADTGEEE